MKKILAIILSLVLCVSMLAGCGSAPAESTQDPTQTPTQAPAETEAPTEAPTEAAVPADPIEALPGSIYYFGYAVEGMDDLIQFYHFYPDDLGIGAVFYAGYAWNQITFSGTYTVEKADIEYEVMFERDGEMQKGTAPYTITLYGWDGAELDKIGYDGEYVYNTAVNVNCDSTTGGGTYRQAKADAAAIEAGAATFSGEKGIAYMNFIGVEDESATLQLNTNGTYNDMVIFAVDGKWAKTGDNEYTLTPDNETDNGAVVTAQEDGTFLYVSTDGTEVVMNQVKEAAVFQTFAGKIPFNGSEADVIILAMDDNTCVVNMSAFGAEVPIDQGTYTFEAPATFTFTFEKAGEIASEFGGETGVQVTYKCDLMGCMLSAASCNKWLCEEIFHTTDYSFEQAGITEDKLGKNHVFFLPYLMGERSPINDTNARGTFIGMTMDTTRSDLVQAVLEGVAFAIRDSFEVAKSLGIAIPSTKVCGGGAGSPLWRAIFANVLGIPLELVKTEQGPGYGGAMLSMVACGAYESVQACADALVEVASVVQPDEKLTALYEQRYRQFRKIYPACKQLFAELI